MSQSVSWTRQCVHVKDKRQRKAPVVCVRCAMTEWYWWAKQSDLVKTTYWRVLKIQNSGIYSVVWRVCLCINDQSWFKHYKSFNARHKCLAVGSCFHNTLTMCECFLSINVHLKVVLCVSVCVHISISVCVKRHNVCIYICMNVCVCVAEDFPVQESMQAAALAPLLLARIYSGFGSMKYLRAPKTPGLTHTCILGLRKENLPRVLFL